MPPLPSDLIYVAREGSLPSGYGCSPHWICTLEFPKTGGGIAFAMAKRGDEPPDIHEAWRLIHTMHIPQVGGICHCHSKLPEKFKTIL